MEAEMKSEITLDLRMTVLPSPLSENPDREDHFRGFHCVLSTWLGDGQYGPSGKNHRFGWDIPGRS